MKNLLLLALLSILPAQAIELKDLRGDWTGTHSETEKGKQAKYKASFWGGKRADGGLFLVETVSAVDGEATYTFQKNGKFKSVLIIDGYYVLSTYTGTWRLSGGVIRISGKGTDGKFSATIKGSKSRFEVDGGFGKSKLSLRGKRK